MATVMILWTIVAILAAFAISLAIYSGLHQWYDLLFWRKIKFASALLGIVGLALFLLNLERTIRDTSIVPTRASIVAQLYELKFFTTELVSRLCAHKNENDQADRDCSDARNMNSAVDNALSAPLDSRLFSPIKYPPFAETNPYVSNDIRQGLRTVNDKIVARKGNDPCRGRRATFE